MKRSSKSTDSRLRILITTGDPDVIGWEVTAKALNALGPLSGVQLFYFRHSLALKSGPRLAGGFKVETADSLASAARCSFDSRKAVEIRSSLSPGRWVEEAAKACLARDFDALVTAPLSKTSIVETGLKDIGHTEILARVCGARDLFMGFLGAKFSVVLATGHMPLRESVARLDAKTLRNAISAARSLRAILSPARRKLPIALVGLNPHAGELGLLGSEEKWMSTLAGDDVHGPLVPDVAFLPKNWRRFSVFVSPYHDQGLIPFKLVHGFQSGVHLTLGLPFVRTSVDHGTAKELFGRNRAQAGSMRDAITTAIRLAKEQKP